MNDKPLDPATTFRRAGKDPVARALADPRNRPQTVQPKKGGPYKRKRPNWRKEDL